MTRSMFGVLCVAMIASASNTWAETLTYAIVDYPTYQVDTKTGLTDHVSGTITADPTTGVLSSASFTITGTSSFTVASATINSPYYVSVSPTQITLTQALTPDGDLRLSGSTGVSGSNSTASLEWYTPADPWIPGTFNYPAYTGTVGSKGSGPLWASSGLGSYPWVLATVTPEPCTLVMLITASLGVLAYAWRCRQS